MKRVQKSPSPQALKGYISRNPSATWKQLRRERKTYHACRDQLIYDQGGICAYCETKVAPIQNPSKGFRTCSVEHFHPKSDALNWHLDWNNMLAVCDGGKESVSEEKEINPRAKDLSCDANKNRMYTKGVLTAGSESELLNPLDIPAFPNIFSLDEAEGRLIPNEANCALISIPGHKYATTSELVRHTILMLNLNCNRLVGERKELIKDIERTKEELRTKGQPPTDLINRYFVAKWPKYFTTLRCALSTIAENHLKSINYQG